MSEIPTKAPEDSQNLETYDLKVSDEGCITITIAPKSGYAMIESQIKRSGIRIGVRGTDLFKALVDMEQRYGLKVDDLSRNILDNDGGTTKIISFSGNTTKKEI